jgi:hypothetical protein
LLLATTPVSGQAQIGAQVSIDLGFPEPPPLVVVSPGVQVVPEYEEEVFYTNNWYWVRRGDAWYRTRDHRGGWVPVRPNYVPVFLNRAPPGRYNHYYRDDDGRWRPHQRDEYHAWRERNPMHERRQWWREHGHDQRVRHEQERAWRDQQRAERDQQRAERDHQRAEMERQRMEQDRARRDQRRAERDHQRVEMERQRIEQDRMRREHAQEMRNQERTRHDQERAAQRDAQLQRRENQRQQPPPPQQQPHQQDQRRDDRGRDHGRR